MVTEAQQGDFQPLILVVEDYPDAREMYAEYLRFSGFRVAEARNGEEALARARQEVPDVVLMDLALPLMDGWEATRRLKSDPRTARQYAPVVPMAPALPPRRTSLHRRRAVCARHAARLAPRRSLRP